MGTGTARVRRLTVAVTVGALIAGPAQAASAWPVERGEIRVSESGGLSEATFDGLATARRVVGAEMTVMHAGTLRMTAVTRGDEDVQRADPGFAYPMVTVAVDVTTAEPVLGTTLAEILRDGKVVMSSRSAALRGAEVGDVVDLEGWLRSSVQVEIGLILPDEVIDWFELVIPTVVADDLDFDRPAIALVWGYADRGVTELALQSFLPADEPIRYRFPWSESGGADSVLNTVEIKQRFGEFAFRETGRGDRIQIDPEWVDTNIVSVTFPILGRFRCHRLMVPYLRSAVAQIRAANLDWLLDGRDFQAAGGCYNARLIRGASAGFFLSRHAWGAAFDVNPSTNPYGGPVRLPAQIGDIFRSWGFAWGAGWTIPDGMHFEWTHFPTDPLATGCSAYDLARSPDDEAGWVVYPRKGRCTAS